MLSHFKGGKMRIQVVLAVLLLSCSKEEDKDTAGKKQEETNSGKNQEPGSAESGNNQGNTSKKSTGVVVSPQSGSFSSHIAPEAWILYDFEKRRVRDTVGKDYDEEVELTETNTKYRIKAHPDCKNASSSCPLYVTHNIGTTGANFFQYVNPESTLLPPAIVVETLQKSDGKTVKDPLALIPRKLMKEFPGLDKNRIYIIGFSAGAGVVFRGLCMKSKDYDQSEFGTTSDLYAAVVTVGGCPNCSSGFNPPDNFHVLAINGDSDKFAGNGCQDKLDTLAKSNNCSETAPVWKKIASPENDEFPIVPKEGRDTVSIRNYGTCQDGDVVGLVFAGEGHVLSYKKNFSPKIRPYDYAFLWLQGKVKKN